MRVKKIKLSLRLTLPEYLHLKQQAQQCGMKMEPYVRQLVNGKEVHPLPPDSYAQLVRELSAIGNNINQLARIANTSKQVPAGTWERIQAELEKLWSVPDGDH